VVGLDYKSTLTKESDASMMLLRVGLQGIRSC
jgi:hypothetical protein